MTEAKPRKRSQADLRAMGVSTGLMAHRVGPHGRSRLEQLTSEGSYKPSLFCAENQTNVR